MPSASGGLHYETTMTSLNRRVEPMTEEKAPVGDGSRACSTKAKVASTIGSAIMAWRARPDTRWSCCCCCAKGAPPWPLLRPEGVEGPAGGEPLPPPVRPILAVCAARRGTHVSSERPLVLLTDEPQS